MSVRSSSARSISNNVTIAPAGILVLAAVCALICHFCFYGRSSDASGRLLDDLPSWLESLFALCGFPIDAKWRVGIQLLIRMAAYTIPFGLLLSWNSVVQLLYQQQFHPLYHNSVRGWGPILRQELVDWGSDRMMDVLNVCYPGVPLAVLPWIVNMILNLQLTSYFACHSSSSQHAVRYAKYFASELFNASLLHTSPFPSNSSISKALSFPANTILFGATQTNIRMHTMVPEPRYTELEILHQFDDNWSYYFVLMGMLSMCLWFREKLDNNTLLFRHLLSPVTLLREGNIRAKDEQPMPMYNRIRRIVVYGTPAAGFLVAFGLVWTFMDVLVLYMALRQHTSLSGTGFTHPLHSIAWALLGGMALLLIRALWNLALGVPRWHLFSNVTRMQCAAMEDMNQWAEEVALLRISEKEAVAQEVQERGPSHVSMQYASLFSMQDVTPLLDEFADACEARAAEFFVSELLQRLQNSTNRLTAFIRAYGILSIGVHVILTAATLWCFCCWVYVFGMEFSIETLQGTSAGQLYLVASAFPDQMHMLKDAQVASPASWAIGRQLRYLSAESMDVFRCFRPEDPWSFLYEIGIDAWARCTTLRSKISFILPCTCLAGLFLAVAGVSLLSARQWCREAWERNISCPPLRTLRNISMPSPSAPLSDCMDTWSHMVGSYRSLEHTYPMPVMNVNYALDLVDMGALILTLLDAEAPGDMYGWFNQMIPFDSVGWPNVMYPSVVMAFQRLVQQRVRPCQGRDLPDQVLRLRASQIASALPPSAFYLQNAAGGTHKLPLRGSSSVTLLDGTGFRLPPDHLFHMYGYGYGWTAMLGGDEWLRFRACCMICLLPLATYVRDRHPSVSLLAMDGVLMLPRDWTEHEETEVLTLLRSCLLTMETVVTAGGHIQQAEEYNEEIEQLNALVDADPELVALLNDKVELQNIANEILTELEYCVEGVRKAARTRRAALTFSRLPAAEASGRWNTRKMAVMAWVHTNETHAVR